jgi:hypothetical protein
MNVLGKGNKQLDPLYVIFEQHLYNFQDSEVDRKTFIVGVIAEYLAYLRKNAIAVPKSLEQQIVEELGTQVNTMLVKKIYGCLSIEDYQKNAEPTDRRRARARYTKLNSGA